MTGATVRRTALVLAVSASGMLAAGAAQAETMKECSLKYQAAKKNNTLNGADWKSFRAAQCGSGAPVAAVDTGSAGAGKSAPPVAAASPTAATTPAGPNPAAAAPTAAATAGSSDVLSGPGRSTTPKAAAPVATGNVVFPSAVSPKYASLSAGKGRMKTCVDQYKVNKAGGGNGGLKWIQKGGGYYSECSKKLKGA